MQLGFVVPGWRGAARALGVALLLLGAAQPAMAGEQAISGAEARQWLERMHGAASLRNYEGTLVINNKSTMSSLRVVHYGQANQSFERVDMLDGQPRRVLRHNDQVLTLWPTAKTARLEVREAIQPFPALLNGSEEQLFERYDLIAEGSGRVAGLEAAVFLLRPRDDARFAQRLWAERASGLLLRADVVGLDGQVLETSAFSQVSIGTANKPQDVKSALKQLEGWRVIKPTLRQSSLQAEGWQLTPPVAGFKPTRCVMRQWDAAANNAAQVAAAEVLHAVFTDGLTHVSLFIEPLRADRHVSGGAAVGATHTWMQAHGKHWVTVVGDVPMPTLRKFADALEAKPR